MNIQPSEAEKLTLAEYQGITHFWNRAHSSEDDKGGVFHPEQHPDLADHIRQRRARLEAKGMKVLN